VIDYMLTLQLITELLLNWHRG